MAPAPAAKPGPRLSVAPAPQPRSPERAALAAAIRERDAIFERAKQALAAVVRAGNLLKAARERRDEAQRAIEAARKGVAGSFAEAARTGTDIEAPSLPMREARIMAAATEDECVAAEAAFLELRQACTDPDEALELANKRVARMADAVIIGAPIVEEMLAKARALQDRLVPLRATLRWLLRHDFVAEDRQEELFHFLDGRQQLPGAPPWKANPSSTERIAWDQHKTAKQLAAFREKLSEDADLEWPAMDE